jgi:uncharacterized membrane protein YfcA
MLELGLIAAVAFGASLLTFFSGFGLGTLLLPVFALFLPLPLAIGATAVVHLANNLFKAGLIGRHANRPIAIRFGLPAILAAFAGAALLAVLGAQESFARMAVGGLALEPTPLGLVIGLLIVAFAVIEWHPRLADLSFPARWMPLGGLIAGFFGGLSGHQGALRSMFLVRAGLSKESFVATGVIIAIGVDLARLAIYGSSGLAALVESGPRVGIWVASATVAAFAGAWLGSRLLAKITLDGLQRIVALSLMLIGLALAIGLI